MIIFNNAPTDTDYAKTDSGNVTYFASVTFEIKFSSEACALFSY